MLTVLFWFNLSLYFTFLQDLNQCHLLSHIYYHLSTDLTLTHKPRNNEISVSESRFYLRNIYISLPFAEMQWSVIVLETKKNKQNISI